MAARINWQFETPSYTWGSPLELKQLDGGEIWVDRVFGDVRMIVEYRPGSAPCFYFWTAFRICSARDCREDTEAISCIDTEYAQQPYCPSYRAMLALPEPPSQCNESNSRPSVIDYQFQLRIRIKGSCRVRGIFVHSLPRDRAPFEGIVC